MSAVDDMVKALKASAPDAGTNSRKVLLLLVVVVDVSASVRVLQFGRSWCHDDTVPFTRLITVTDAMDFRDCRVRDIWRARQGHHSNDKNKQRKRRQMEER